jgi:hypothetical protein
MIARLFANSGGSTLDLVKRMGIAGIQIRILGSIVQRIEGVLRTGNFILK